MNYNINDKYTLNTLNTTNAQEQNAQNKDYREWLREKQKTPISQLEQYKKKTK